MTTLSAALSLAILGLAAPALADRAEPRTGNYAYVEIRDANGHTAQGPIATNVVPLWPVRACFGWVVTVPQRNRFVELVEIQKMPAPTRFAGDGFTINATGDTTTARRHEFVGNDGRLQNAWCINDADPEGVVTFEIHVEGRLVAEFKFCAVRLPDGEPFRLEELTCPRRFMGS
ncbi:MAG: hypothetical protein KIT36_08545 [Alphaproteobacteria bacterium]|nr:hypothetical protein [Alphaproteobacteria bacterium]